MMAYPSPSYEARARKQETLGLAGDVDAEFVPRGPEHRLEVGVVGAFVAQADIAWAGGSWVVRGAA